MNLKRSGWLTFAAVLVLSTSQVFAGGNGGTKKNSKIHVTNNSSLTVGVSVDGDPNALAQAVADQSISEFKAAGGVILNPGDAHNFSVKAGTHSVFEADSNFVAADNNPLSVTVASGKTKGVLVNDNGAGGTTLVDP